MKTLRAWSRLVIMPLASLAWPATALAAPALTGEASQSRFKTVPAYIAMLRGINVGGQKIIRMEQLRRSCAVLGFKNVETYVQSGNIVFLAAKESPSALSKRISEGIRHDYGFPVPVLVRTAKEMEDVIRSNPFLKEKDIDAVKLHVTFLSNAPLQSALKRLETLPVQSDRFHAGRREIYLYCPDGYGRTKLSNTAFEKVLIVEATTRNWKTVNTLFEMAARL
jgi:uncharacterized protein (DUF1697 family)